MSTKMKPHLTQESSTSDSLGLNASFDGELTTLKVSPYESDNSNQMLSIN